MQPGELKERVAALVARVRDAERELEKVRREQVQAADRQARRTTPATSRGIRLLTHDAGEGAGADDLRDHGAGPARPPRRRRPVGGRPDRRGRRRPAVVVATNAGARERGIKAGALVRVAAQTLGGGGGGKDDLAQGGGTDASRTGEALGQIDHAVQAARGVTPGPDPHRASGSASTSAASGSGSPPATPPGCWRPRSARSPATPTRAGRAERPGRARRARRRGRGPRGGRRPAADTLGRRRCRRADARARMLGGWRSRSPPCRCGWSTSG